MAVIIAEGVVEVTADARGIGRQVSQELERGQGDYDKAGKGIGRSVFGGVVGGWLAQHYGFAAVFMFCGVLIGAWLIASLSMTAPLAIKTRMFHVGVMDRDQASLLRTRLASVAGVVEAAVLAEEGVAMLKIQRAGWDESAARSILQQET